MSTDWGCILGRDRSVIDRGLTTFDPKHMVIARGPKEKVYVNDKASNCLFCLDPVSSFEFREHGPATGRLQAWRSAIYISQDAIAWRLGQASCFFFSLPSLCFPRPLARLWPDDQILVRPGTFNTCTILRECLWQYVYLHPTV